MREKEVRYSDGFTGAMKRAYPRATQIHQAMQMGIPSTIGLFLRTEIESLPEGSPDILKVCELFRQWRDIVGAQGFDTSNY